MAAVFGRRLRRGAVTAAVAAAAVAALSASQAPGVPSPQLDNGRSAADSSDEGQGPDGASGPDYYTDLPKLNSPTDDPTAAPGAGSPGDAEAGIPATVLDAYKKAEAELARTKPGCNVSWELLAAIGKVESGQARGGNVDANGTTIDAITGPPLNGKGFAHIKDTDGGLYDGDTVYDRAVGPMQFIPTTWAWAGRDGNGDGKKDPNNIYDAALATGHYLCRADRDLSDAGDLNQAILSYNHSSDYLATVLSWLEFYRKGAHQVPDGTGVLPRHPSTGGGTNPTPTTPGLPGTGGGKSPSSPKPDKPSTKPTDPPESPRPTDPTDPAGPTDPPTSTSPAETVTKLGVAGTGDLSAMAGDVFTAKASVRATNAQGRGVGSVQIRFAVVGDTDATFSGGATTAVATTNSSGVATAPAMKAGEKTGEFTVRATVVGRSLSGVDHKASVTARAADALARVGDKELSCVAGQEFADRVTVKATYKGAVADGVAATATLIKSADDATEADKGPYFKDADGKAIRTFKGLETADDGTLVLPKLYADDATGTFLLRVTTTGGATLTVELKVTAAPAGGASESPAASESPSPSASPSA
ncbi:lytic transglycosylase domain-containing protein [Streptomyces xanthii]|uniref:Lytic murein transglycosylase n=1 Tax=Streptomyces xanthii TaxID=2768069 RepID=A0A7H1BDP1_9ACTN|nr:lytic transglycosylase domain-containing protein [Streptomyces xanthii]QNS06846.1 lytic murein transglycosylase [Streptomyces xanthii]